MMRRIALVNLKGGVGKTVTAVALAVGLARRGYRVLLVDSDPSGNASWTISGGQGAEPPTLANVLARESSADEAIRETSTPGLDLLPSDSTLAGVGVRLAQELSRDTRLRSALDGIEGRYDFVIVDTGPTFSTLLANVLVFAHEIIVPIDSGVYAVLGLVQLQDTIAEVREAYGNTGLRLAGLVLTKVQRNNVSKDVETELRTRYGPLVFKAVIPHSAKVEEGVSRGASVIDFAPKSAPAVAYGELVTEVIEHGGTKERCRAKVVGRPRKGDAA
jgi:chromosome partitioning protein